MDELAHHYSHAAYLYSLCVFHHFFSHFSFGFSIFSSSSSSVKYLTHFLLDGMWWFCKFSSWANSIICASHDSLSELVKLYCFQRLNVSIMAKWQNFAYRIIWLKNFENTYVFLHKQLLLNVMFWIDIIIMAYLCLKWLESIEFTLSNSILPSLLHTITASFFFAAVSVMLNE